VPDPASYKAPPGRGRAEAVAEQDTAAGGRESREVALGGGIVALGSIELKFLGGRRIYAYLRYMREGRTVSRYVGESPGATRADRLAGAWARADALGLLGDRNS
jgi:DNA mismatch endonuclease (patch repair protein)